MMFLLGWRIKIVFFECVGFETHAQSFAVGFSSPAKMSSSSCSGLVSKGSCSSGGSSSAMVISLFSSWVLNWFAVLVLACVGVILPNANLALLVDPYP